MILALLLYPLSLSAAPYYAVSLNALAAKLKEKGSQDGAMRQLGGISRLLGAVYTPQSPDVIIFGQAMAGEPALNLDDFVVALRAIFIHDTSPLVSIDKTESTLTTKKQTVRFEGGIAGTNFGRSLLAADVILKKMGLGQIVTEVWGSKSYFDLIRGNWQKTGREHQIQSRFWFKPADILIASRSGVAVLEKFRINVQTQILNVPADKEQIAGYRDDMGEQFAGAMSNNFEDLMQYYMELGQLRSLFNMVGVATGIKKLAAANPALAAALDFWLKEYPVPSCETPSEYPLLTRTEQLHRQGQSKNLTINGGIELKALINDINDGVIEALRDVLIKTRPQPAVWKWRVPLEGWQVPVSASWGENKSSGGQEAQDVERDKKIVCSFSSRFSAVGQSSSLKDLPFQSPLPPPTQTKPEVNVVNSLTPQRVSPHVGGVMLRGVAQAAGKDVRIDISRGNFSLVIDGENARLSPEAFRKFITALWSVYYVDQAPGISIDPIEPGGKKHLVRYIGKVVNTDLGRVMREADYIMKKWAVGTDKPAIPGFKDVDALSARHGLRLVGASRRFWFVPEAMRFKQGGGLLLFEDGHMTLKTEYRLQDKGAKAEPADEAFARFFTNHYPAIAAKYPVYQELFEYAKLVSLARYLKEQGVPLLWFLLANRDQVLVEDSPGTVDALAKGSKYFEGLYIEGGVDLGFQGQYVYDSEAVKAITATGRKEAPQAHTPSTPVVSNAPPVSGEIPAQPVSFEVGRKNYTAVPQHALTSGRDRRGLRYQTDLALRQGSQPGLELVRYFNPWRQEAGEFGNGWHLLIPYQIKPAGEAKRKFLNAVIPEKMALWNLISGQQEILTFSTNRYSIAGYVPENLARSQVIGLFPLSDASYRLADKLGNEFWFDQAGFLTDMIFSKDHHIHLEYLRDPRDLLEYIAYQVKPADAERVDFLNVRLPKRMQVTDQRSGESQTLTFNGQGDKVGYAPQDQAGRFRFLALMTNGSFRLLLKDGAEIPLDRSGVFLGKGSLPDHPLAKAISLGSQKITFAYTFGKTGNILISQAIWHQGEKGVAPVCVAKYEYDDEGRLARVTGPQTGIAKAGTIPPIPVMLSQHRVQLNSQ
jgi:hypothetical protein